MENLTHSLLGAVFAELALPADATPKARRIVYGTALVASNIPDADLLYTSVISSPLVYLLHHRGHTHTIVGVLALAALMLSVMLAIPALRVQLNGLRLRIGVLIAASLAGHLLMDSWNSYGVHPFWPIDNRWVYGDAIYIAEPWLWLLLGVAVVLNTQQRRTRLIFAGLLGALFVGVTALGAIGIPSFLVLLVAGFVAAVIARPAAPRVRSIGALAATALFVAAMFVTSHAVRNRVVASMPAASGTVLDVVLDPNPANPLCWAALAIVKNEAANEYSLNAASIPIGKRIGRCGGAPSAEITWAEPTPQKLDRLRALARDDCRVRAWMQFGRAPLVVGDTIADARYGGTERGNFSSMTLPAGSTGCPGSSTNWTPPRADLLE